MKDLLKISFIICLVIVVYIFKDNISTFIMDNIIYRGSNKVLTYNEYYLNYDYNYVQNIDSRNVKNYQEVLNIFYTIINSGDDSYSFYCDYSNCLNDVKRLIADESKISNINNFVHPFNSFSTINIDISNDGKITVKNKKTYNDEEIIFIKTYIDTFITENIKDDTSTYDKIKLFHDHIINNTEYDVDKLENSYDAYAYNLLINNKAICGGYSDIMSIYLNELGIQNYKITSENHIWNLVNVDGTWYHIDMTWDDPVASDGKQYLIHNFFLITTNELHKLDSVEHNFNTNIYIEAK
ncbi:MAG: hypothetical protein E7174_01165 [Firmicutes bacterium]|nr:hypothetical protein [Bacillota bacterium]